LLHLNDANLAPRIEALVTELEKSTNAEIVVVAAPRSGAYRDVVFLAAGLGGLLVLAISAWSPLPFSAAWLPLDFLLASLLVGWIIQSLPQALRALTSQARRRRQVLEAASHAFLGEAVHGTRGRTGVLVYLSALEGEVVVLRDLGLDGQVPGAEWNLVPSRAENLGDLLEVLRSVGRVLAAHVPPLDDNPDEIPNAPRILR
jgi:putative membrane protein